MDTNATESSVLLLCLPTHLPTNLPTTRLPIDLVDSMTEVIYRSAFVAGARQRMMMMIIMMIMMMIKMMIMMM